MVRLMETQSSAEVGVRGSLVLQMPSGEPLRETNFSADGTRDCGWMKTDNGSQISKKEITASY